MSIRILFADPDEALLETYRDYFESHDFDVATVASGPDCLTALAGFHPDVVVLEPDLPDGGGRLLLEQMGRSPQLAAIPVLILSRRDPQAFGPPVCGVHTKPVSLALLTSRILACVNAARQVAASASIAAVQTEVLHRRGERLTVSRRRPRGQGYQRANGG